jgi:hypothetical protein
MRIFANIAEAIHVCLAETSRAAAGFSNSRSTVLLLGDPPLRINLQQPFAGEMSE